MKKNSKAGEKRERTQNVQTKEPAKILKMEVQQLLRKMKAKKNWKSEGVKNEAAFFIGIDIGDKSSRYCLVDAGGEIVVEDSMATTQEDHTLSLSPLSVNAFIADSTRAAPTSRNSPPGSPSSTPSTSESGPHIRGESIGVGPKEDT
jgi:hypothetical protein